ncbi:MAG: single-stranded DNA-binding protein, partial [Bacillota bacterium]
AEFCSKYFVKGQKVVVVGSIQNRTWDDNEGKRHYVTEIIAEETYFAESRKAETGSAMRPPEYPAPEAPVPGDENVDGFFPLDDDDELPF